MNGQKEMIDGLRVDKSVSRLMRFRTQAKGHWWKLDMTPTAGTPILSSIAASAPIPLKAALNDHTGSAASEIESHAKVNLENAGHLPISAAEKLVHFGLGSR